MANRTLRHALPTGTVTFLFTDIEGSTKLLEALGDRYAALLADHGRIMRDAIAKGGGTEVNTEGDAFFAVFPSAHRAVQATADMQRQLAGHAWPEGTTLRVRMGLHTGDGRLGGMDYVGLDVHRAARIAGAGNGGQVLISDATRALVEPDVPEGVRLRDLGAHRLKDLARPERIYQLEIAGLPSDFAPIRTLDSHPNNLPLQLTSFIGRDHEIAGLRELIDQTLFERTKDLRRWAREAGPTGHEARNLRDRVAAAEASLGRAPGRPPMYSDEHFKLVADAYTRAWKISPKPRQAVAAQWHVSPSTAAKWVARARKMGFLPPTERGRPLGGRSPVERTEAKSSPQARRSRKLEEIDSIEAEEAMQRQVVERHDTWLAELTGQPAVDGVPPTASGNTRGQRGVRLKGNTKKEQTRKKR